MLVRSPNEIVKYDKYVGFEMHKRSEGFEMYKIFVEVVPRGRVEKSREVKRLEDAKYYKSPSFKNGHEVWEKNSNFICTIGKGARRM